MSSAVFAHFLALAVVLGSPWQCYYVEAYSTSGDDPILPPGFDI